MPLATVSRKLADRVWQRKTRLITRSTRMLLLTEAGRAAAGACTKVRGPLVIAAPIVTGRLHLLPVVAALLDPHPEGDIQLRLGDRNVRLIEEHIDLALRTGPEASGGRRWRHGP